MPLPADLLLPTPGQGGETENAPFLGARWAFWLASALLGLLALTIVLRSLPIDAPSRVEKIIQQPVTPTVSAATAAKPSEVTAPDPGDNPLP